VLTDFDGTLSPIVDDPEAARPLPDAPATLSRLARRYRTVAVISGRPVAYLVEQLGPSSGVTLVGLYGLEKRGPDGLQVLPGAHLWRPIVDRVASAAETELPSAVYVERKGLTVGLHVRRAPEYAQRVAQWAEEQARATGLVVHRAKMSVELVPPIDADKGTVVAELAEGLHAVCYLGDDVGDLPAFAALRQLAAAGRHTLAVAVRGAETPPQLLDQADLQVDGPEGALAFLNELDEMDELDD
jgi:trehalose 6-phosphate phosphatase